MSVPRAGRPFVKIALAVAAALASLALSGCFVSDKLFLDTSEAEAPLVTGTYSRPTDRGEEIKRVTREPDGWYLVEIVDPDGTLGDTYRVLFNKLDLADDRKGYAFAGLDSDQDYFYGVMVIDNDGVHFGLPDCAEDDDRDLAENNGADFDDQTSHPACRFHDPDSLKAALAAYVDQTDMGAPFHLKP